MSQNEPKMDIWDPFGYFGMPFQNNYDMQFKAIYSRGLYFNG